MIESRGHLKTQNEDNEEDELRKEIETDKKLSTDRYISFLDNVMMPSSGFGKGKADSSLQTGYWLATETPHSNRLTLRQFMTETLNANNSKKGSGGASTRAKQSKTSAFIYKSFDSRAKMNSNSSKKNDLFF